MKAPADAFDLSQTLSRRLTILGSTGSIGVSTLSVVDHARATYGADAMPLEALTAQSNVEKLAEQARTYRPRRAVIGDPALYGKLKELLDGTGIEATAGKEAVTEAAAMPAELVMVAIVGAAGLPPALKAVERGATIALANKECVVAAGDLFRRTLANSRATVIPVNSEHNAAFQCLEFDQAHAIDKVILTASGGPFREWTRERMQAATPEQAVAHPNWSMGAKISVDSATLMNKGLEVIEAHFLFALPAEKLDVIVHPQSAVHCLVTYTDGSMLAHLSAPDMRTPIAHALAWPRRIQSPAQRLDLAALGKLTFEAPDRERFPCLALAESCLRQGGLSRHHPQRRERDCRRRLPRSPHRFLRHRARGRGDTVRGRHQSSACRGSGERAGGRPPGAGSRRKRCAARSRHEPRRSGELRVQALTGLLHWAPLGLPAFLFVITVVVFFHELGHFLVARACGVAVEVFSIGFGPAIFGWNDKHGTRWKVSWIPLGGYVKFAGDADAASTPDREKIERMAPEERAHMFHEKPLVAARAGRRGGTGGEFRAGDRDLRGDLYGGRPAGVAPDHRQRGAGQCGGRGRHRARRQDP